MTHTNQGSTDRLMLSVRADPTAFESKFLFGPGPGRSNFFDPGLSWFRIFTKFLTLVQSGPSTRTEPVVPSSTGFASSIPDTKITLDIR